MAAVNGDTPPERVPGRNSEITVNGLGDRLMGKRSNFERLSSETLIKGTLTRTTQHEALAGHDEFRYIGFTPNEPIRCH